MAGNVISLKLVIDTKEKRVLFAEADRYAADFLFHILALPLSTVTRLLDKQQMAGSIGNLYESIESLGESHCQIQTRALFTNPIQPFHHYYCSPLLSILGKGENLCLQASPFKTSVPLGSSYCGFVKEAATFMVMDDLVVKPITSVVAVLNMFNSKNIGAIEERVVEIGIDEVKNLLKTSLVSKKVLTEVFLNKIWTTNDDEYDY